MPEANLVGGSERDREQILQLHADYIDANARFDWQKLEPIWSAAPEAVFFNLNGHTYNGREHWFRLWKFYGQNVQSSYWTPFDLGGVVSDDMAVVWCHRRTKRNWTGAAPPPKDIHYGGDEFITRSTMVFRKEAGGWRVVHAHFSEANSGERGGDAPDRHRHRRVQSLQPASHADGDGDRRARRIGAGPRAARDRLGHRVGNRAHGLEHRSPTRGGARRDHHRAHHAQGRGGELYRARILRPQGEARIPAAPARYAPADGGTRGAGARALRQDRRRIDDLEHVPSGVHASSGARGSRLRAAGAAAATGRGRAIHSVRGAARSRRGLRSRQGDDRRDAAILLGARSAGAFSQGGIAEGNGVVGGRLRRCRPPLARGRAGGGGAR